MSSTLIFIILVLCLLLKPNRVEPVHHDGSIADTPKLDDPKSSVPDGVRAPQLKLDDHDASLPLAGCALLEHDAEASSALKRELHHNSSRAVAARSSKRATKRAKLALSQGQRSRRLRIAYTSFRRLHRPRHQRVVSVCRGGLDPIDILAPLLAGMSLQPTCSDAIQVDILGAGLAALSLQPTGSDEVDCNVLGAGLAALSLQLKLDDHDASLPLTVCALLEHDAEASSALKRELHHNSSRAVAPRSSKRAKLALSQGQRSRRLRLAYTSLRQLHRPRHQRIVSVCRGGLDPIDILAPLLAGMSVQPTCSDAIQVDILAPLLASMSLQPTCSDAIQVDILGAGVAALSLQPTGSDEVGCDVLGAGLAALSLQPTGSDAMECESLAFALTALSLPSKKRNRDEFEEDAAAINVDARPYKRARFTPAPRPGRVPHSSWIAARRRLLLIWSRIAWSRIAVPLPATVAVPPSVVPIPIISPIPNVVVSAPAVLQNCTNTFVSGTGPNANDVMVGRKSESRSGGAGSVKRTQTPSARENAAPFPVSCKTKAYLVRGM